MRLISYIKKATFCLLVAMLTTKTTSLVVYRTIELSGFAILLALLIVPSIIIYYVLDFFHKAQKVKVLGFLAPIVVMIIYCIIVMWIESQKISSDGSGEMAKVFIVNLLVGSIVVLSVCIRLTKR